MTPPDEHGYVNLGLDTFYTENIMDVSDWIIAEVNENMPRTYGQTSFHVSRFTAFVENRTRFLPSRPPPHRMSKPRWPRTS